MEDMSRGIPIIKQYFFSRLGIKKIIKVRIKDVTVSHIEGYFQRGHLRDLGNIFSSFMLKLWIIGNYPTCKIRIKYKINISTNQMT